ncbi:hypothetical protein XELAEV_18042137mg [Xenopus laevis]|uniref:Uncharacterized protein n=1 Tax=Xenopus laevis TaxID=8355 RepID=A0A974C3H5_XENLA|nr:hypothetical protein XELAEV_18042137mg [Xenopus laevis]
MKTCNLFNSFYLRRNIEMYLCKWIALFFYSLEICSNMHPNGILPALKCTKQCLVCKLNPFCPGRGERYSNALQSIQHTRVTEPSECPFQIRKI